MMVSRLFESVLVRLGARNHQTALRAPNLATSNVAELELEEEADRLEELVIIDEEDLL